MAISLEQLNREIVNYIPNKQYIIESEVSGVSVRRGNTYFDFKEKNNKLSGMIWRNKNTQVINDGDKIKCSGQLSYYAPYGKLSFQIEDIISKSGMGDIYKDFIILRDELNKEGIFDASHKKKLSGLIEKVIIITSKEGAAIQDIYRNLSNHNSKIIVEVKDAPVQGINCHTEIANILNKLNKYKNTLIILTRGGGDYQDLNGFNQEKIVRSIYNNNNIIISAIGHDTDTVLSDLVADYTLPTPSLVAQFLIDYNNNILNNWENLIIDMERKIRLEIQEKYNILQDFETNILQEENKLDLWISKLENDIREEIYQQEKVLEDYIVYLESIGEIKILNNKEEEFTNLEDIGQLFKDKSFYLKIKDRLFKISDFIVKEKY